MKALGFYPDQSVGALTADLDHLQTLGVDTVWLVLAVEAAFPSSTTIDSTFATRYDTIVNGAQARGMTVTVQAHGNPSWNITAGGHTGTLWHGPDNTTEVTNWVACVHNFLNRYDATKIGWVECWNEPDLEEFWEQGWNNDHYARLLRALYLDIKASWPAIKVVGHNMSRNHDGWLEQHYAWWDINWGAPDGATNKYGFDVLGIHPYCGNSTSGYAPSDTSHGTSLDSIGGLIYEDYTGYRQLRARQIAKEGFAKPLAFGEFGYATMGSGWFKVTESQRAGYIASALNIANADGYVDYLNVYYHWTQQTPSDYATSFNIHGTTTETAFAAALTGAAPSAGGGGDRFFDGVTRPLIQILAGFGGQLDPGADYLHLGVGPGLGTAKLSGSGAGTNEVDITGYVRSVAISERGRPSDIDTSDLVTCTLVLNNATGIFDPENPASPYAGQLADGTPIRVRWIWADVAYDRFYGELSQISCQVETSWDITATFVAMDALEKLGRAYLPQVAPLRDGDTTGQRISYLADQAQQPSTLRAIDTGASLLNPTELGESALELMRKTERTDYGFLFVDGGGRLVFYSRHRGATATRSTTVQATFGDDPATIPIRELAWSQTRDRIVNRAAITRDPAPDDPVPRPGEWSDDTPDTPVEQVADDAASQGVKGVLAFPGEVGQLARNDSDALAMAQYLVGRYVTPATRISGLSVNGLGVRVTSQYGTLLALGPLDLIALDQDYGSATVTAELQIQGITEDISYDPPAWDLLLTTSPPPPTPTLFVLGTAQLGSATTGRLGW